MPLALGHTWFFRKSKELSEPELMGISSEFEGINGNYIGFHLVVFLPLLFLAVMLFLSVGKEWMPLMLGLRLFPLVFVICAVYGFFQASFAIYMGVYPMGRSLLYIYDEKSVIRRAAKIQIMICLVTYSALFLWAALS